MNFNFDETHTYPPPLAGEVDRRRVSGDGTEGGSLLDDSPPPPFRFAQGTSPASGGG